MKIFVKRTLCGRNEFFPPPPGPAPRRCRPIVTTRSRAHGRQKSSGLPLRRSVARFAHGPATFWLRAANKSAGHPLIAINRPGTLAPPSPTQTRPCIARRACVRVSRVIVFFSSSYRLVVPATSKFTQLLSNFRARVSRGNAIPLSLPPVPLQQNARAVSAGEEEEERKRVPWSRRGRSRDRLTIEKCDSAFSRRNESRSKLFGVIRRRRCRRRDGRLSALCLALTFTGPLPQSKEKSDRGMAEVLYKLDVSRIFPARRCVSGCRFRYRAAI